MKILSSTAARNKLTDEINLARLRLTEVETKFVAAKEQARLARQRRKAAKLAARLAKKRARLAKARVGRAEVVLAKLETRLAQLHRPPAKTKPRKITVKKTTVVTHRKNAVKSASVHPHKTLKIKTPVFRRVKARPTANQSVEAGKTSSAAPAELEAPVMVLPPSEHKPMPQIVKEVEEIFTRDIGASENASPEAEAIVFAGLPATPSTI